MIINVTNGNVPSVAFWKAERFLIQWITSADAVSFAYQNGAETVEVATYQTANGGVLIDVTNFARAYPERNTLIFSDGTNTRSVTFNVSGLINPAGVLIPERDDDDFCKISAPSLMLAPFGSLQLAFEMWSTDGYNFSTGRVKESPGDTVQRLARSVTLAHSTKRFELWYLNDHAYRAVDIQPLSCERIYACVEWVSFTGQTRRHVFEITKAEVETGDVVNLANILNEWTEIKGREDGFTLRLENLDRYDLWYYSDLITSSRVRVTIDGTKWYDVHVDKNNYTLPESNAGKLSTLEIPVKFRKYDAVSL